VTFFSAVLFLHVGSALLMVAAVAVEAVALNRLGRAQTPDEAHYWINVPFGGLAIGIISAVALFLSGGYMAAQLSLWTLAWPRAAVQGLVLASVLGAIAARRIQTIRRTLRIRSEAETFLQIDDPFLKISLGVRTGLVLGIVFLMTTQPGLVESVGVVSVSASLGLAWALVSTRRRSGSPATTRPNDVAVSE